MQDIIGHFKVKTLRNFSKYFGIDFSQLWAIAIFTSDVQIESFKAHDEECGKVF